MLDCRQSMLTHHRRLAILLSGLSLLAFAVSAVPVCCRDAGSAAGLNFILDNGATPEKHMIETMAGGLAIFDYDNDGRPDIYFTNGAAVPSLKKDSPKYFNRLFRNEGDMKFRDVTASAGVAAAGYSMGAAVGDFDNDGNVDL